MKKRENERLLDRRGKRNRTVKRGRCQRKTKLGKIIGMKWHSDSNEARKQEEKGKDMGVEKLEMLNGTHKSTRIRIKLVRKRHITAIHNSLLTRTKVVNLALRHPIN